jgi:ribonuclease HII
MPTVEEEWKLQTQGYQRIAGLDEAGRGCWAGPVVAAAVMLGEIVIERPELLAGVNDSKQLRPAQRAALEQTIRRYVAGIGIGIVPAYMIDWFGIVEATRLAMELAILHLPQIPDALLIDALRLPRCPLPQHAIIRGDSASLSIAAASVIAKTARDRLMTHFDRVYPAFRFGDHKGYGTAAHASAIAEHGVTVLHRRSFRPLWHISEKEQIDAA